DLGMEQGTFIDKEFSFHIDQKHLVLPPAAELFASDIFIDPEMAKVRIAIFCFVCVVLPDFFTLVVSAPCVVRIGCLTDVQLKSQLNTTKNKLDNIDLQLWSKHTNFTSLCS